MRLAKRLETIKPSATLAIDAKAKALKAAGHDVISLAAGEPDFPTPEHICTAAVEAIKNGEFGYTAIDGTARLKQAIITKLKRDNNLDYKPENVIAATGAKQALFNMLQALLDPGDEVLVPTPAWVSYPDMVRLAEATPVEVYADASMAFKVTPIQLEASITDRTRLLMLNSPSNPTGKAYSKAELQALGEVLERHPNIAISSDEIYEHIYWGEQPYCSFASACPNLFDRTFIINGVSKAYAMTGWRSGFLAGPEKLVAAMRKLQSQSTSNPCSIAQAAAAVALDGDQQCVSEMCAKFKQRHDWVIGALNQIPGVLCESCDGAFYAFPSFQGVIERLDDVNDDVELAAWLLENTQVAVVPGSAFGAPGHLRLSYATSMNILQEALSRINAALAKIA